MTKDRANDSNRVANIEHEDPTEWLHKKFGAELADMNDKAAEEKAQADYPEHWYNTPETQDEMAQHYSKEK
jgi:hypothetical protein